VNIERICLNSRADADADATQAHENNEDTPVGPSMLLVAPRWQWRVASAALGRIRDLIEDKT
jgi:hypothetical protein